jgi:hypothetical protein
MTVLGQDATSVEAYQRYMVGPAVMDTLVRDAASRGVNLWPQVQNVNNNGIPVSAGQRSNTNGRFGTPANPLNPLYMEFRELFDPTGFFGLNDRPWPWMFDLAMQSNFRKVVHNFADEPRPEWMGAPGPMIDGLPFSETEPVLPFPKKDFNFIGWLAAASFDQIRLENFRELYDNEVPEEFTPPTSLLYRLLRHAVLLQFWDAALQTYEAAGQPLSREEKELFNILSPDIARWDLLYRPSPLTGNQPLYQELQEAQGPGGEALDAYRKQVAALADLPTAHLERALAEHLDLGTYRLDAWKTAFVQYRLTELRKDRPTGSFIGAFGWLEDVTPQDKSVPVNGAYEDPDNLGYIHAPTINHATAAAVLRQGYKSRQFSTDSEDPAANRMAVNLSSERVRRAQATLESIRTGQSLGSVLGQYFERALRDAIVPTLSSGKPYASLIPDYRRAFPYAGEKTTLGQPAPDPAIGSEQAERQVVDGLALLEQAKLTSYYPLIPGIPRVNQGDNDFIAFVRQELKALADTVDALGDLTVGESIYQAVVGNMEQAGAMLENVAKGRFPTAPEVVHTPRGGTSVTHRVLLQLPSAENGQPMLEHWGTSSSPRALAEPGLNAWLAPLIGYPEELVFSYQYKVQENVWDNLEISLADAQLQPIDLLFLTEGDALRAGSGLDMYLAQVVRAQHHDQGEDPDGIGEVDFSWPQAAPSNFRRLLPMLARIRQLLGLARAAVPTDLANPSRQAPGQPSPADAGVIFSSVEENLREVRDGLSSLASQLADAADGLKATLPNIPAWQLWDLRVLMQTAVGYGVTEAGPATNPALIDPVGSALAIEQLIQRRLLAAEQLPGEETTAYYVSLAQALLGPAFRLAPSFTLDGDTQDAYAQAMEPDRLESLLKAHADDALLTHEWLQSVAPVREPMDHLEKVTMLHDLLHADESGYQPLRLTPTQLTARPLNPNDSDYWLGVSYPEGYVPPEDAISLVQLLPEQYNAGNPQQAFVLDEWTEIIPAKEEVTSVAFHYDQPNTEAPQTLLLVVSPDSNDEADWRWEALLGAVNETLDLAKKRAIEPDTLAFTHLGMLLPAIIAPVAQQGTTITLDYRLVNGTAAFGNLTFGEEPLYSTFQ